METKNNSKDILRCECGNEVDDEYLEDNGKKWVEWNEYGSDRVSQTFYEWEEMKCVECGEVGKWEEV